MKTVLLSFLFITLFSITSVAQTIKGKANLCSTEAVSETSLDHKKHSERNQKNMRYGNVLVFDQADNLVNSVLTDEQGNYELALKDTGTYKIKVLYAGYETVEESITVTEDVNNDFSLKRDFSKKERKLPEGVYAIDAGYLSGEIYLSGNNAQLSNSEINKGLTSGEINDFSKWQLWNDYLDEELSSYQETWRISPHERYLVQVNNHEKSALVGARVSLLNTSGDTLWQAVSDNTGKAELWASIYNVGQKASKIIVESHDELKELRNPKPIQKGMNTIKLDQPCGAPNLVEIAFVVDATGSMCDEINFIKRDLNEVMFNTQNLFPDLSINYGSVFYRDKEEAYVTKHLDLTNVLSEALVFVDEQFAKGGKSMPEAVDAGLDVAINQLSWSSNARSKLLFLILDAPPHNDDQSVMRIQELTQRAAAEGIKIIPISGSGINKSGEYLMRALALATNGTYLFLTDHSGIGSGHIEPTIDEYEMRLLSDRLKDVIKSNIYYPPCEEIIPELEIAYPDSVVTFTAELGQIYPDSLLAESQLEDSLSIGISENEFQHFEWRYYPNPTRDYLTIECSQEIEFIYLTDLSGKLLREIDFGNTESKTIFLGDYPAGIYLLRYPTGKKWVTGKVVLMR